MYNKTFHALISRINPKINPTLKLGHSSVCTVAKTITFPIGMAGVKVDEANSVFTGCTPFAYFTTPGVSYAIGMQAGEINKLVLDDGTILIPTPGGFKDVSGNGNNATSTTMTMSHISDSSVFHCEEYGFAVKSGVIYPALLDGTGYAGLVGVADKYFPRGMISRRGSIDIEAWNYLDSLIDFGGSAGVLSAGIIINQFDGTDCNDDLITTAEPKLDPAEIAILAPASGDDIELDKNFTVSGTSNCTNVKIDASADGTTWVTLAASVAVSAGAFSKADCQLPSADFDPNDEVTIRVSDVDSISLPDTVAIDTIATITITPAIGNQTAGVAFDVAGTTDLPDGAEVEVFAGATSKGTATVASGAFTKSVTIADPANDVVIKVQDKLNANAYDTETIDVTSASYKIQIDTVDCSFTPYDTVAVGADKIAIHGRVANLGTSPSLGGVSISKGSSTYLYAIVLYNVATSSIVWVKSKGDNYTPCYGKCIQTDGSYVYGLYRSATYVEIAKISLDGSSATYTSNAMATSQEWAGLQILGSSLYIVVGNGDTIVHKRAISNLANEANVNLFSTTGITEYRAVHITTDGTYIYISGQKNSDKKSLIIRMSNTLTDVTVTDTVNVTAGNAQSLPIDLKFNGSTRLVSYAESLAATYDVFDQTQRTVDGTNTNSGKAGRFYLCNGLILQKNNTTSYYAAGSTKIGRRLSASNLSTVWEKDYTSDAVTGLIGFVYVNSKYYMVGYSSGNFDGSHGSNTVNQAIIGAIDIDSGDL